MALLAGGCLVLRNEIGRDPAAVLNVVAVLACPVPDFGRVQRRPRTTASPAGGASSTASTAAHLACVGNVPAESGPELFRVLRVQVDLIFRTVESEAHGPLRRPAVNVVYEECCDLLGHLRIRLSRYRQLS